jgi:hypothetical protein
MDRRRSSIEAFLLDRHDLMSVGRVEYPMIAVAPTFGTLIFEAWSEQ